jgi:hypothetical protein
VAGDRVDRLVAAGKPLGPARIHEQISGAPTQIIDRLAAHPGSGID